MWGFSIDYDNDPSTPLTITYSLIGTNSEFASNYGDANTKLGDDFVFENLDKVFQTILKAATYEFMYKPQLSLNIIIKEYLNSSNFFLENSQTKYLNALLDNVGKKLRSKNA